MHCLICQTALAEYVKNEHVDDDQGLLFVFPAGGVGIQRVMHAGHAYFQACGRHPPVDRKTITL